MFIICHRNNFCNDPSHLVIPRCQVRTVYEKSDSQQRLESEQLMQTKGQVSRTTYAGECNCIMNEEVFTFYANKGSLFLN
jgi:hypothetical protein